jgi:hypothetical protein
MGVTKIWAEVPLALALAAALALADGVEKSVTWANSGAAAMRRRSIFMWASWRRYSIMIGRGPVAFKISQLH